MCKAPTEEADVHAALLCRAALKIVILLATEPTTGAHIVTSIFLVDLVRRKTKAVLTVVVGHAVGQLTNGMPEKCNGVSPRQAGRRWAKLELPYYGSITMCIIDPMHNLFWNMKKMFKIWCENDLLTTANLRTVNECIEKVEAPSDLGHLPGNIRSNYGGFTADQWKNWVLYYSMYALEGISSEKHDH